MVQTKRRMKETSRAAALSLLRKSLQDETVGFRERQWESIEQLVNKAGKRLVVERTGWGKSAVYFIATRILRDQQKGLTLLISPLLSLMNNQIQAAQKLGLCPATLNSSIEENEKEKCQK